MQKKTHRKKTNHEGPRVSSVGRSCRPGGLLVVTCVPEVERKAFCVTRTVGSRKSQGRRAAGGRRNATW